MSAVGVDSSAVEELIRAAGWSISRRPACCYKAWTYYRPPVQKIKMPPRSHFLRDDYISTLAHELVHAIGFNRKTFVEGLAEEQIADTASAIMCLWFGWPYNPTYLLKVGFPSDLQELRARLSVVASLAQGLGWPPVPDQWLDEDRLLDQACEAAGIAPVPTRAAPAA